MTALPKAAPAMRLQPKSRPWPGLSQQMSEAFNKVMRGQSIADLGGFIARRHIFFHRLPYAAAGFTAPVQFFKAAEQDFICNVPGNGVLPAENAFLAKIIRVTVDPNMAASSGAITGAPATAAATYIAAVTGATNTEQLRNIYSQGRLNFRVSGREIVNVVGLRNFPSGGGVSGHAGGTVAAASVFAANNGLPMNDNGWKLYGPGYPILPSKQMDIKVDFQAVAPLTGDGSIMVEVEGILVTPANL